MEVLYWTLKYEYKGMVSKYIDTEINVNLRTQTYMLSYLLRVTKSNEIPVAMNRVFKYHALLERESIPWRTGSCQGLEQLAMHISKDELKG